MTLLATSTHHTMSTKKTFKSLSDLTALVGQEVGASDWVTVSQ